MGTKIDLGKALYLNNSQSIIQFNNATLIVFSPIKEAFEQNHFIVNDFNKRVTMITNRRLELMLLKRSETCALNDNAYTLIIIR